MEQYKIGQDEQFYIGHFNGSKTKLNAKAKALREWHFHPESEKLFINIRLGGQCGLRKAVKDGVQLYFYPNQDGEIFVNIDWMIDRGILGTKQTAKLIELKNKILQLSKEERSECG